MKILCIKVMSTYKPVKKTTIFKTLTNSRQAYTQLLCNKGKSK